MRLKYIIFHQRHTGKGCGDRLALFVPVVFPEHVTHDQVKIEGDGALGIEFAPVRAGFVSIKWNDATEVTCSGHSVSLKLSSNPEIDARLIKDHVVMGFPLQHQLIYESYDTEVRDAELTRTQALRAAGPGSGNLSRGATPPPAHGDGSGLR